ncbi:MAG TPA: DUF6350 family protein [Jatrophihabitantaceae bacterium]|nr:DUF6350 family protein [Jatrophihabitantaceae bacterium]
MPGANEDLNRRSVVPQAANRSLWFAAIWTGVGAAVVCATAAIVAVAICWLPVSGPDSSTSSAVRAGLLTFLAGLHGGITVDGVPSAFVPLGLTLVVAITAWRAGSGLADAAESIEERDPIRLAVAGAAQAASFAIAALIAIPFAHLGTSSAPYLGVGAASLVLFGCTGGVSFVRSSALAEFVAARAPGLAARAMRPAAAAVAVYLGTGALVVAASLVVHHGEVEALSRQVGGGWGGLPILLLGMLAAPNAAIAGASYLAGPGFAVGAGASVSPFTTAHGTVPAFPILGALPSGSGAPAYVWPLVIVTPLAAGVCVARLAWRSDGWRQRLVEVAAAAGLAGLAMCVLAWQGGGAIGDGGLRAVGASPWLLGLVTCGQLAAVGFLALASAAGYQWLRSGRDAVSGANSGGDSASHDADEPAGARAFVRRLLVVAGGADGDDTTEGDQLAG